MDESLPSSSQDGHEVQPSHLALKVFGQITRYKEMVLESIFLAVFAVSGFAAANPCNSASASARSSDHKNYDNCKKFSKAWVKEYKLQRHPIPLSEEMENHVFRVEKNRQNIECIEYMAGRVEHLTESDLADLKRRNSQNISNALVAGQEKGRLSSEAIDTYRKIVDVLQNPQTDKGRIPALSGCLLLIDQRYDEIQRIYDSLPKGKSPAAPATPDSPNQTELI